LLLLPFSSNDSSSSCFCCRCPCCCDRCGICATSTVYTCVCPSSCCVFNPCCRSTFRCQRHHRPLSGPAHAGLPRSSTRDAGSSITAGAEQRTDPLPARERSHGHGAIRGAGVPVWTCARAVLPCFTRLVHCVLLDISCEYMRWLFAVFCWILRLDMRWMFAAFVGEYALAVHCDLLDISCEYMRCLFAVFTFLDVACGSLTMCDIWFPSGP
jgi:hypothetical protein